MNPNDPLSLAVPVIGIALTLVTIWATGGARPRRLDQSLAARRAAQDIIGFHPIDILVDRDGRCALLASSGDTVFVVAFMVGHRIATRKLAQSDLRRIAHDDLADGAGRLTIETPDFTHARFDLIAPAQAISNWAGRLERLRTPEAIAA